MFLSAIGVFAVDSSIRTASRPSKTGPPCGHANSEQKSLSCCDRRISPAPHESQLSPTARSLHGHAPVVLLHVWRVLPSGSHPQGVHPSRVNSKNLTKTAEGRRCCLSDPKCFGNYLPTSSKLKQIPCCFGLELPLKIDCSKTHKQSSEELTRPGTRRTGRPRPRVCSSTARCPRTSC